MSELKRVPIATIGDVDKEKKASSSVRLELKLFEPNAVEFPEFNYQTLLHGEKKKRKKMSKINGFTPSSSDPFENDDDVARIAKELEKKYGTNSSYTKKRSGRIPGDLCDKGAGYDESDSFIDNTEAYDELIPDEIETVRGGFYINSGPLEFQHLSNYERPDDAQKMPKPKKRVLSTSSSSSEDDNEDRRSVIKATGEAAKNGHHEKKIKTSNAAAAATGDGKSTKTPKVVSAGENTAKRSDVKAKADAQDLGKERLLKTTTVKDMLRAKRDNLRNMQEAAQKRDNDVDGIDLSSAPMTSESSNESTAVDIANGVKPEPKLPANLSEDILRNIIMLKEAAKVSASLGKANFFDAKVQEVLLRVENATRSAGGHIRNQVYSYLEAHLPCSKQTLMLRAKKMRIQQEEARVEKAVVKLKRGIEEVMPGALEAYKKEYERVMELKNGMAIMGIPEKENDLKLPKKQFPWTDTTRDLLNAVVSTCRAAFSTVKSRKVTFEDYIMDCLVTKVLPIWPQGWMKIEGLLKEMDGKGVVVSKVPKEGGSGDVKVPSMTPSSSSSTGAAKNPSAMEKLDTKVPSNSSAATSAQALNAAPSVATTSFPCSSSLTITPVSSTAPTSKPLPVVQNKVTITNVDGVSKAAKVPAIPSVPPHLPSGLSISITSSSTPPPLPVVTHSTTVLKTAPRSPPKEATPPPKKSFDYSISSIISSTTSATPAAVSANPPAIQSQPAKGEAERPVIDVEEKVKQPPTDAGTSVPPPKTRPTPSTTVIAAAEKVNSAPKPDVTIFEELSSTTSETDSDTDSSSDCEIIENSPNAKKKITAVPKTTILRAPKPPPPGAGSSSTSGGAQMKRDMDPLALTNDNDIDVNQIMKELKELQEFQQVNSRATGAFTSKKTSDTSEYSIGTLDAARLNELKRNLSIQQHINHHPELHDEKLFHEITEAVISSVRK